MFGKDQYSATNWFIIRRVSSLFVPPHSTQHDKWPNTKNSHTSQNLAKNPKEIQTKKSSSVLLTFFNNRSYFKGYIGLWITFIFIVQISFLEKGATIHIKNLHKKCKYSSQ